MPAPQLTQAEGLPSEGGNLVGELTSFELRFDQVMDPNTVNAVGAFALDYAGADGLFGTADDLSVSIPREGDLKTSA